MSGMTKGLKCKIYKGNDLRGIRFGKLLVVEETDLRDPRQSRIWKVVCDCGTELLVSSAIINRRDGRGVKTHCGCSPKTRAADNANWKGCGDITGGYWSSLRFTAKARGLEFQISIEYAWRLYQKQNAMCALSGCLLTHGNLSAPASIRDKQRTASLDRIDSTKGYIADNLQWVHKRINAMKSNMTDAEFVQWCKMVSDHDDRCTQVETNTGRLIA